MIATEYTKNNYPNLNGCILSFMEQICYIYDGKSIMEMFKNIDYQTITYECYLEQVREPYQVGLPKLWILNEEDSIQGFCMGYVPNKKTAFLPEHIDYSDNFYICSLFVLPRFQRKNGGKLMLKTIINFCYKSKLKKIFLNVEKGNIKALNFYKKMGLHIYNESEKEYFMEKLIYINLLNP